MSSWAFDNYGYDYFRDQERYGLYEGDRMDPPQRYRYVRRTTKVFPQLGMYGRYAIVCNHERSFSVYRLSDDTEVAHCTSMEAATAAAVLMYA